MQLPTTSHTAFRHLTRAGVVLLGLVVVTGGAVRLTGSGLGCPTWPKCGSGSFVTRGVYSGHGWIEFGNRVLSLAVGVLMIVLPVLAVRLRPRRKDLLLLSCGLWLGFVGQAVLGGLTVLYKLNPALVAGHFLLSMLLLADAVVLDRRARQGTGAVRALAGRELIWLTRLLAAVAAAVLVLGTVVTGTGPNSGDSTRAQRFGFDIRDVAQLHADSAMVLTGLVIATLFALRLGRAPLAARRHGYALASVVVAQAGIGFTQYVLGIPPLLVSLHIVGATLLWIVTLSLSLSLVERPVEPAAMTTRVPVVETAREPLPTRRRHVPA